MTRAADSTEPVARDPLQGASDWLKRALVDCTVGDIQRQLLIGYNRARRLFDSQPTAAEAVPPASSATLSVERILSLGYRGTADEALRWARVIESAHGVGAASNAAEPAGGEAKNCDTCQVALRHGTKPSWFAEVEESDTYLRAVADHIDNNSDREVLGRAAENIHAFLERKYGPRKLPAGVDDTMLTSVFSPPQAPTNQETTK